MKNSEKNALTVLEYEGQNITFQAKEGLVMVNAAQMAKSFKKAPADFLRLKDTQEYISILGQYENSHSEQSVPNKQVANIQHDQIVLIQKGGKNPGTWMHELLAMRFAQWLSPRFAVWVDIQIRKLLKEKTEQTPNETKALPPALQTDTSMQMYEEFKEKVHHINEYCKREDVAKYFGVGENKFDFIDGIYYGIYSSFPETSTPDVYIKKDELVNFLLESKNLPGSCKFFGKILKEGYERESREKEKREMTRDQKLFLFEKIIKAQDEKVQAVFFLHEQGLYEEVNNRLGEFLKAEKPEKLEERLRTEEKIRDIALYVIVKFGLGLAFEQWQEQQKR